MTCYRPLRLVKKLDCADFASEIDVPCGKCYSCLQNKQQDWVNRLVQEQKHCLGSYFVTLTYDNDHVPMTYTNGLDGFSFSYCFESGMVYEYSPTLDKDDLQRFMKRLRKHVKCRFFACGEYGSTTIRPHYHLCLFLQEDCDLVQLHDFVEKSWKDGFISVSDLNESRMAYCAKYLVKGGKYPEHSVKPFCLMSRRPGIGESYIDQQSYNYHLTHPFLTKVGGVKQRLPRYWKNKMSLNNDGVVSDAMELEYRKTHKDFDLSEFGKWREARIRNHERIIEKKLSKDIL